MAKPTISVIMTNYNYGHFLPDALNALVRQSYRPAEILIIDDASTDNSVEVIESFRKGHPEIRLIRNKKNQGVVHNVNVLQRMASGDYIYGASSDDRVLPGLFEQSIDILLRYPNAALSFSDPSSFETSGGPVRENRLRLAAEASYLSPEELVDTLRLRPFEIASHTSLIKRPCLQEVGFIPELRWHCDWFAWWTSAFRHGACYVPGPLATIRVHPQSYSSSSKRTRRDQVEILERMFVLLRTTYKDVAPIFRRSAVVSCFKTPALQAALRSPENRTFLTPLFVGRALWYDLHSFAAHFTPEPVRAMYRRHKASFA